MHDQNAMTFEILFHDTAHNPRYAKVTVFGEYDDGNMNTHFDIAHWMDSVMERRDRRPSYLRLYQKIRSRTKMGPQRILFSWGEVEIAHLCTYIDFVNRLDHNISEERWIKTTYD